MLATDLREHSRSPRGRLDRCARRPRHAVPKRRLSRHASGQSTAEDLPRPDDRPSTFLIASSTSSREGEDGAGSRYCLMPNHYHLVFETPGADLSGGHAMAQRPIRAGVQSVFMGWTATSSKARFHSVLVESDWHLLELSRYLALNPVRAGLCADPGDWQLEQLCGHRRSGAAHSPIPRLAIASLSTSGALDQPRGRRFEAFVADARPEWQRDSCRPRPGSDPGRGSRRRCRRPGSGRLGGRRGGRLGGRRR